MCCKKSMSLIERGLLWVVDDGGRRARKEVSLFRSPLRIPPRDSDRFSMSTTAATPAVAPIVPTTLTRNE